MQYLEVKNVDYRLDPSNEKDDYLRNRIRHTILPVLKKENQLVHHHFQRMSEDIVEDEDFLEKMTKIELQSFICFNKKDEIQFSINQRCYC